MTFTWRLLLIVAAIFPSLTLAAPGAQSRPATSPVTRVALVGNSPDPRLQSIRDIAEVQLGQPGELQVLDRQSVDRILTEQGLSLTAMVDADHAVKVGKVLAADLLAVVESSPKSQGAAIVIFDPASGVRLWDSALPTDDGVKSAQTIVDAVREAAAKRGRIADLHTICLMTVRNADLPHDMDGFCDAVGRLLERNLVGSSRLALLERSRLEKVDQERALNSGAARADLFPSLVTIELEISRASDGHGLRAAAFLSDSQARSLGKLTAPCKQDDAVALAEDLAGQVAARLKLPPGASGDRVMEAARFFREAQLWTDNSEYAHALAAAEAAHALAPENVVYYTALARAMVFNALPPPKPGPMVGVWLRGAPMPPSLLRGVEMVADVLPLTTQIPPLQASVAKGQLNEAVNVVRRYVSLKRIQAAPPRSIGSLPQGFDVLSAPLRRYLLTEDQIVRTSATPQELALHLARLVYDLEFICSRNSAQWSEDLARCIEQWLDLHARHPSPDIRSDMSALNVLVMPYYSYFDYRIERRWKRLPADYERFTAIQKRMQRDADPLVSGYGDLLELVLAVAPLSSGVEAPARNSPDQMRQEVDGFIAAKKRQLIQSGTHDRPDTLRLLYHLMCAADQLLDGTVYAGKNSIELLDLALSRDEIESGVVIRGVAGGVFKEPFTPAESARRIAVIERVLRVAHAPGTLHLDRLDEAYFRVALAKARHPRDTDAGFATTRPWITEKQLVNALEVDDLQNVMNPIVQGDSVYLIGATARTPGDAITAQLLRVPLAGGPVQRYGSLPTTLIYFKPRPQFRILQMTTLVMGSCFAEGKYCVATRDQGLMIFATDGSPAKKLDEKNGLPTAWGQSIALLDGTIYAAMGKPASESYLISCDPAGHHVDVLASSARRDIRSPFDDGTAFDVQGLIADPPRHRLVAVIERIEGKQQVNGIWEYRPAAAQWKLLLPLRLKVQAASGLSGEFYESIVCVGPARNERFSVATSGTVFLFDLRDDRARALLQASSALQPLPKGTPDVEGMTDAGRNALQSNWPPFLGLAELDPPWVWNSVRGKFPWSRCNYITGQREYLATLRPNVPYAFTPRFMEPVGDGSRIIVGDQCGLWLLSLGTGEGQEKR